MVVTAVLVLRCRVLLRGDFLVLLSRFMLDAVVFREAVQGIGAMLTGAIPECFVKWLG